MKNIKNLQFLKLSLSEKWVTYLEDAKTQEIKEIQLYMGNSKLLRQLITIILLHLLEMNLQATQMKLAWKLTLRSKYMKKKRRKVLVLLEILISQKMLRQQQQLILHAARIWLMKKNNVKMLLLKLNLKKTLWITYLTRLVLV